jgi:hypothetical protein
MASATKRGLTQETIERLGIDWNPSDHQDSRESWGLAPELNEKGNAKKVKLPAGLVIPTRRRAGITAVKVHRTAWTPDDLMSKYMALPGSVPGMAFGRGNGLPVVIGKDVGDMLGELGMIRSWVEAGLL